MSAPVLSVIIPTRNRSQYAGPAIRSVLSSTATALELVVEDNSTGDDLEAIATAIGDARLKYRHSLELLDMSANFGRGLEAASGQYVTFLGDDDGVNPEVIEAAHWAAGQNLDAVVCGSARYCWPDHRYRYWGGSAAATLQISGFSGRVSEVDPQREIRRCLQSGGSCFYDLPKIYYGIVKREILEAVKARAGVYFPGPSPDLAGAIAVACLAKRVTRVDYPLFVPGTGARSMGGLGAMKQHVGRLEDFPHLPRHSVEHWSPLVPRFFSGSTIWGENVVESLTAMGEAHRLREFNVSKLHARSMVFCPRFAGVAASNLYPALTTLGRNPALGAARCIGYVCESWLDRLRCMASRVRKKRSHDLHCVRNLDDIGDAVDALTGYLRRQEWSLARCLAKANQN